MFTKVRTALWCGLLCTFIPLLALKRDHWDYSCNHAGHNEHHIGHHFPHHEPKPDYYANITGWYHEWPHEAGWHPGYIGEDWYLFAMPSIVFEEYYDCGYPYWGYGLGFGQTLALLARENRWDVIIQKLIDRLNFLEDRLRNEQIRSQLTPPQINTLVLTIKRIQAHLDGIMQPR